jgi:AAA family ATP:ADP antiporter
MEEEKNGAGDKMKSKGFLYKFLRLFFVIHPGEVLTSFLLAFNIFLILTAYYFLKPVRKALILTGQSPEKETYLYSAMAVLLVFIIKGFSYLSSKVTRHILIMCVTLFFVSNLIVFYILHLADIPLGTLSVAFYLWVSIYNYMLIALFWGFSNDIYTEKEGKRLFPMIVVGQTLGALFSTEVAPFLIEFMGFGAYHFLLVTAGILCVCVGLTFLIHKREVKRPAKASAESDVKRDPLKKEVEKPLKTGGGFRLIFKSQYLLYIALFILVLNLVNSTGEYIRSDVFNRTANEALQEEVIQDFEEAKTNYVLGLETRFLRLVNRLSFLIQLLLVSRIFKWFGIRVALMILPFIALGGYAFMAVGASLVVVRWTKALENSTDYSLMNTVRASLFLITSREEKYKAKAAIDTFFVRAGDLFVALIVFLGSSYLGFTREGFAKFNVAFVVVWIIIGFLIIREHKKLSAQKSQA